MQRTRTSLLFAILLSAATPLLLSQADVSGIWRIQTDMHDGTFQDRFLDLKQTGDAVTGTVSRNYDKHKVVRGTFRDDHLYLEVNPWREVIDSYDGQLKGDELELTIATRRSPNAPQGESLKAIAKRSNA
ncbi:MAG: hypothetical protein JOZ48_01775, partial [Acidobacteriaceae bacterium]|nr:hypothetical protein [Acidobacteriaceae bacterium]